MRRILVVPIPDKVAVRSPGRRGFTIIETLIALSMVMLVTHVILRSVPGIYKAGSYAEKLQLERSMWYSVGAEEWLHSPDDQRPLGAERDTDREGWLHFRPAATSEEVHFWRGPVEAIQRLTEDEG